MQGEAGGTSGVVFRVHAGVAVAGVWQVDGLRHRLMLGKMPKGVKAAVDYMVRKFGFVWQQVWAQRAQERAAIKAHNEAWMLEEELATMQIGAVTTGVAIDESASPWCDEGGPVWLLMRVRALGVMRAACWVVVARWQVSILGAIIGNGNFSSYLSIKVKPSLFKNRAMIKLFMLNL